MIYSNDSRFESPFTEHGMSSRSTDPIYFEIGGKRCQNSTNSTTSCVSDEEIDKILEFSDYSIYFLDNYFDVMNYKEPIVRYTMEIMGRSSPENKAMNYINFNNVDLQTHDGLVFDNTEQISSYKFIDRVEIVSKRQDDDNGIFFIRLEGLNRPIFLDRTYLMLQEVLANNGGLLNIIFLLAKCINFFYCNFVFKQDLFWKIFRFLIDFKKSGSGLTQLEKVVPKRDIKFINLNENDSSNHDFKLESPSLLQMNKHIGNNQADEPIGKISSHIINNPKNSIIEIRRISFMRFCWLKLKMLILRKKDRLLKIIDKMDDFHKNILNEGNIYKLYIENEKLKLLLFNQDQRVAFEHMKLNYKQILMNKMKDVDMKSLSFRLKENNTKLDQNLLSYLDK